MNSFRWENLHLAHGGISLGERSAVVFGGSA